MEKKIRWGILGPGTISQKFATGLKAIPDAEITAVGSRDLHIEIPFKSNGFENQAIEVINCLREGKLESDVMPLDESLSIIKTMDTIRFQWGLRYPEFRSIFATPT